MNDKKIIIATCPHKDVLRRIKANLDKGGKLTQTDIESAILHLIKVIDV